MKRYWRAKSGKLCDGGMKWVALQAEDGPNLAESVQHCALKATDAEEVRTVEVA